MDKKKIMLYGGILIVNVILAIICGKAYSEFKITRGFESDFSSYPFYFDATVEKSNYTFDEKGIEIPLTITNFSNDLFNDFNTDYEVILDGNDHFSLTGNDLTGQIAGKNKETKVLTLTLKAKNTSLVKSSEKMNLLIKSTSPYAKEIIIPITIRNGKNPYMLMEELAKGQTDEHIDFTDPNIDSGVFLHFETKNDKYPVYYYRGSVDNNVVYANYCWKIVRTTENGGVKLLYNDKYENGGCHSTHDYLGSEPFNEKVEVNGQKYTSPSQAGFMYGEVKIIETVAPSYLNDNSSPKVIEPGTIFGNDVTYNNITKEYTLKTTTTIEDLNNLEDQIRGGKSYGGTGYHYTCLSLSSSCKKVYYIYFNDYGDSSDTSATGLFGIMLDDGLNVTETLDKILFNSSNENSSHVKKYLDEFYEGTSSDFERSKGEALVEHESELEDVPWCNDRSIAGYHGWEINNDNHIHDNKYLHFKAFGRLIGDEDVQVVTRPDVTCDGKNDTFTVSSTIGNGKLTHPIGLLTADEAVLAGAVEQATTNCYLKMVASKNQTFMTPYYISDDHVRLFSFSEEGKLSSIYSSSSGAIRPVIAITSDGMIASGDGTADNPYIIEF